VQAHTATRHRQASYHFDYERVAESEYVKLKCWPSDCLQGGRNALQASPVCPLDRVLSLRQPRYEGGGPLLLTVVYGVLVIGLICLLALGGLELVQRLVPADSRRQHNDVAGFIYAALGVIYAVLLALVVIAVWEEYRAASETVEQEANALAEIFWLAHRLPEPEGSHLQELATSYAEEVVDSEWPLMEQGEAPLMTQTQGTPAGWTLIDDIRANLQEVEPSTPAA
jgi:hypothetical protein